MTGHYYNHPLSTEYDFVPVNGIEPLFKAYESFVLPLNYTGNIETVAKPHLLYNNPNLY